MAILGRSSLLSTARVDPEVQRAERQAMQERPPGVANISVENLVFWRVFTVNVG
jgi:hypothetical protein